MRFPPRRVAAIEAQQIVEFEQGANASQLELVRIKLPFVNRHDPTACASTHALSAAKKTRRGYMVVV